MIRIFSQFKFNDSLVPFDEKRGLHPAPHCCRGCHEMIPWAKALPTPAQDDLYQLLISASFTDTLLYNLWVAKSGCEQHTEDIHSKNKLL